MKVYEYVGPPEIAEEIESPGGVLIGGVASTWGALELMGEARRCERGEEVVATYTVDASGALRLAHRRSEHVRCAGGVGVWGAGEVGLEWDGDAFVVVTLSNQSTGYCPSPECFDRVCSAMREAGWITPDSWTRSFRFEVCVVCGALQIIKDEWLECIECGSSFE